MPAKRRRYRSPASICSKRLRRDSNSDNDSDRSIDGPGQPATSHVTPQPLTEAALDDLNRLTSAEAHSAPASTSVPAESASSTSSSTSTDEIYARLKLEAYRIYVDSRATIPVDPQAHINTHIKKPRTPGGRTSPHAQRVVDKRADAANVHEQSAVHSLEPALMAGLHGDGHGDEEASVPGVAADFKCKLNRAFIPTANINARSQRPTAHMAMRPPIVLPCRPALSLHWHNSRTCTPLGWWCPRCSTSRSSLRSGSARLAPRPFTTAQTQSARDGAVIVNLLHKLYGPNAALADTCHFSYVTDGDQVQFFVHWCADEVVHDEPATVHHMKWLDSFSMRKTTDMREARKMIKNIAAYAIGPRLAAIRTVVEAWKCQPLFHISNHARR